MDTSNNSLQGVRRDIYSKPLPPKISDDHLLNNRLAKVKSGFHSQLQPRKYQSEIYEQLLKGNTIIYLGTGLGKTFIIAMYLNSPHIHDQIRNGFKVTFLATTQDLTKQQAEFINKQVPHRVKIFCGRSALVGQHIDHWDRKAWLSQLESIDILFMTPKIFNNAISTNHLDWCDFSSVIFDEVHHASLSKKGKESKSDYSQALKHYHSFFSIRPSSTKPRLIGLTASLINQMPSKREDILIGITGLEKLLSARCVTDEAIQSKNAQICISAYNKFDLCSDPFEEIFTEASIRLNDALKIKQAEKLLRTRNLTQDDIKTLAFINRLNLAAAGFSIKPASLPKVMDGLRKVRESCGLWALRAVCKKLIVALGNHAINPLLPPEMLSIYVLFNDVLRLIERALDDLLNPLGTQALLSYTSMRPRVLLENLKDEYEKTKYNSDGKSSFSCIVFVKSRLEVVALNEWLQGISSLLPEYSFLRPNYAVGIASLYASKYACLTKRKAQEQYRVLESFRGGDLNTLITTSVLEEGIDLPICSTVIRYDLPGNFRQYVQSRGRARQQNSSMIFLSDHDKLDDCRSMIAKFNEFELTVKEYVTNTSRELSRAREPRSSQPISDESKVDYFTTKDNSIHIGPSTAKTILNMYCNHLSKLTPFTSGITYEREYIKRANSTLCLTILFLPSACSFGADGVRGGYKITEKMADDSAAVAAVKLLYENKELNENGAPARLSEENVDEILCRLNFDVKYGPLESGLEGIGNHDSPLDYRFFEPKLFNPGQSLSLDPQNKLYKLLKIWFEGVDGQVRVETRPFIEKPTFGLIFDSSLCTDFIPEFLMSHYGKFNVRYEVVNKNLTIQREQDHHDYLNYTYRFLTRCLCIPGITRDNFSKQCLFYIVPLECNLNQPLLSKMRTAFYGSRNSIERGDVVKINKIFLVNSDPKAFNQLYLVKSICHDLNPHSKIPGMNTSFIDDARKKFGPNVIRKTNQRVIEVMPISRKFAKLAVEDRRDMNTNSIYYLEQFIDLFDDDSCSVFQSFLMPPIIYRIYQMSSACKLDRQFIDDTRESRKNMHEQAVASTEDLNLYTTNSPLPDVESKAEEGDDDPALEIFSSSDEEHSDHSDEDSSSEDEEDHASLFPGPEYEKIVKKQALDLNHEFEDEEKWDLSMYQDVVRPSSITITESRVLPQNTIRLEDFRDLVYAVRMIISKLVNETILFAGKITADSTFLNEESELEKRFASLDLSIIAPLFFDKIDKPLKVKSRQAGLLEALSVRAENGSNLETLENLGDSYLKYATSVILISKLDKDEGFLTSCRSRLTSNRYFCYLAMKKGLGFYAITKPFSPDMFYYVLGCRNRQNKIADYYNGLRPKNLADIFEAIIGAYLVYSSEFEATLAMQWLGLNIFDDTTFSKRDETGVSYQKARTALLVDDQSFEFKQQKSKFSRFEKIIRYNFKDPSFLIQAFTHASHNNKLTRSYERLEFLGDAVLDYLVTMTLVHLKPGIKGPGEITGSRSALVNNFIFARLSIQYKYDLFIQHMCQDLYDELNRVRSGIEADPDMEFLDMADYDKVVKLLADVFESVAGAIYLDSGCSLDAVWRVYFPIMKNAIESEIDKPTKNLVVQLYETFPGPGRISFETFDSKCEDGFNLIGVRCRVVGFDNVDSFKEFEGLGSTKFQAKRRAIQAVIDSLPPESDIKILNIKYREKYATKSHPSRSSRHPMRSQVHYNHRNNFNQRTNHGGYNFRKRSSSSRKH